MSTALLFMIIMFPRGKRAGRQLNSSTAAFKFNRSFTSTLVEIFSLN